MVCLSQRFGLSRRQAYRYLQEARVTDQPLAPVEVQVSITIKIQGTLAEALRAHSRSSGEWIGEIVAGPATRLPGNGSSRLNAAHALGRSRRLRFRSPARRQAPIRRRASGARPGARDPAPIRPHLNALRAIEAPVGVHPAAHRRINQAGHFLQRLVVSGGRQPPRTNGASHLPGSLIADVRQKADEVAPLAALGPPVLKGVAAEWSDERRPTWPRRFLWYGPQSEWKRHSRSKNGMFERMSAIQSN